MSHLRHRRWHDTRPECGCALCAELDLRYPGEGIQLGLPMPAASFVAARSQGARQ
jgi:hypothetical protein